MCYLVGSLLNVIFYSPFRKGGIKKKMDSETENNGNYFLALLNSETSRLNSLVSTAERDLKESDDSVPEEVRGNLRVAVGKAKMLMKRKFLQFQELCYKNLGLESSIRYTVTSEDLAGYWDTIVIEILQVYQIFEEIDILRKNNWEEQTISPIDQTLEKKMGATLHEDKIIMGEAM